MQLFTGLLSPAIQAVRAVSARAASNTTLRLAFVAVATAGLVVACDRVNLTAPTGSTVSVSVDRSVIPLGGEATVTAVVIESAGTPVHNGTAVTFQTTVGTMNPPTAFTVNGIATSTLVAGTTSGVAAVSAFSGGARGNSSASVSIGAAAASGNISVSSTPPSVSQSGGTVTISAAVFDNQRNPLSGINVQFVASTGVLSATSATTDSSGIARTQLTTTQTATVNAFAGSATGSTTVTVSAAPNVTLTVPETGTVGVAVPITIAPAAATGTATPQQIRSVVVDLGDGNTRTFNNVTGNTTFTHTYSRAGGFTVTATTTDVSGNTSVTSDAIVISRGTAPAPTLTMTPNPADVNQVVGFSVSTAAPTTGQQPVDSIRVFINGELAYSTSGPSGAFTRAFSATGTYAVIAEATDAVGNVSRTQGFLVVEP